MLPALAPTEAPKGIAEVVMIPIVPAILNAIYDATGHRFQSLPVTQAMLKGVLVVTTDEHHDQWQSATDRSRSVTNCR